MRVHFSTRYGAQASDLVYIMPPAENGETKTYSYAVTANIPEYWGTPEFGGTLEGVYFSTEQPKPIINITYNQNHGSSPATTVVKYFIASPGSSAKFNPIPLPNTAWIPANRYFRGWNDKADGSGTWYKVRLSANETTTKDLTLYAIWGYEYTVTYYLKESSSTKTTRKY